jgi:mycothiol synthase
VKVPPERDYILRAPRTDEAPAVQDVLDTAESADAGEPRRYEDDVATLWRSPRCHPEHDWWVAEGPGGGLAAVGWVFAETDQELTGDYFIHPDHVGRRLGTRMLDAILLRGDELARAGRARSLEMWANEADAPRLAAWRERGFVPTREYFEMEIALSAALPSPVWPSGITPSAFRSGSDERVVYLADQEAFSEHHLFSRVDFDEWRLLHLEDPEVDVTLWLLAWDGAELAGFITAYAGDRGALIDDLAVRKPWRGRGVARALLHAAFRTLFERGQEVARLFVDAQNVTNAAHVYHRAGMHVSRRFEVLQKELAG